MQGQFGLRLKWLGCACFELDFGEVTVVSDPWITANVRTECTWENVERCDYITVSHGHYDHVLDIPKLAEKFSPCVLCGEQTRRALLSGISDLSAGHASHLFLLFEVRQSEKLYTGGVRRTARASDI